MTLNKRRHEELYRCWLGTPNKGASKDRQHPNPFGCARFGWPRQGVHFWPHFMARTCEGRQPSTFDSSVGGHGGRPVWLGCRADPGRGPGARTCRLGHWWPDSAALQDDKTGPGTSLPAGLSAEAGAVLATGGVQTDARCHAAGYDGSTEATPCPRAIPKSLNPPAAALWSRRLGRAVLTEGRPAKDFLPRGYAGWVFSVFLRLTPNQKLPARPMRVLQLPSTQGPLGPPRFQRRWP